MELDLKSTPNRLDNTQSLSDLEVFHQLPNTTDEEDRSTAISLAFSQFAVTLRTTPPFNTFGRTGEIFIQLIQRSIRHEQGPCEGSLPWHSDELHEFDHFLRGSFALRELSGFPILETKVVKCARVFLSVALFVYVCGEDRCGFGEYSAQEIVQAREGVGRDLMALLEDGLESKDRGDEKKKFGVLQSLFVGLLMGIIAMKFRAETVPSPSDTREQERERDLASLLHTNLVETGTSLGLLKPNSVPSLAPFHTNLPTTSTWDILPSCDPSFIPSMTKHQCKLCSSYFKCASDWDEEEEMGPCCARCRDPPQEPRISAAERGNWYLKRREGDEDPWGFYG